MMVAPKARKCATWQPIAAFATARITVVANSVFPIPRRHSAVRPVVVVPSLPMRRLFACRANAKPAVKRDSIAVVGRVYPIQASMHVVLRVPNAKKSAMAVSRAKAVVVIRIVTRDSAFVRIRLVAFSVVRTAIVQVALSVNKTSASRAFVANNQQSVASMSCASRDFVRNRPKERPARHTAIVHKAKFVTIRPARRKNATTTSASEST